MYAADLFPFCYEKPGEYYDGFLYQYRNVTITENFGPFTKGQKFDFVWVDYDKKAIEAYNNIGTRNEEIIEFSLRN